MIWGGTVKARILEMQCPIPKKSSTDFLERLVSRVPAQISADPRISVSEQNTQQWINDGERGHGHGRAVLVGGQRLTQRRPST